MEELRTLLDDFERQLGLADPETKAAWAFLEQQGLEFAEGSNGIVVLANMLQRAIATEREACAVVASDLECNYMHTEGNSERAQTARTIAAAIRAREVTHDLNNGKRLGDLINQSKPGDIVIWVCKDEGDDEQSTD